MLRFLLLGPFEAWRDETRVASAEWRTQKTLAVLKILLDARGRVVPAERIADLVWPDADPTAARNSLRVAVRAIRTVLQPDLAKGTRSRFVVTEGSGYRMAADGLEIDVDAFIRARDAAAAAQRGGDTATAVALGILGLRGYRGDYLADEPEADWALAMRERLHEQYVDLAERVGRMLIEAGRHEEAVEWMERAIAIDPLREGLYAALMRAHAAAGRQAHIALIYERAARALASGLGLEPSPALRVLRDHAPTGPTPRAATRAATSSTTFVGRARELAQLTELWRSVGHGGVTVFVSGTAGVGKTRLAREFAGRIERDARVIWATASESAARSALAPFRTEILRLRDNAGVVLRQRIDEQLARLDAAEQLPERAEALTQTLRLIAGGVRTLLVFDDAHWADSESLTVLDYVARRLTGLMAVVTVRSSEPAGDALTAMLDRPRDAAATIRLDPLETDEVRALLRALLPDADVALAARIHGAAGGIPLFVHELIRAVAEVGPAAMDRVPDTLAEVIDARVRRLGDREREVLVLAASAGGPVDARVITLALSRDVDGVLSSLDVLLARDLVRASEDGHAYRVAHPVIQRAVYDALAPGRRAQAHRRLADALGALADQPAAVAAERLRHLIRADAPWREIADTAVAAADFAMARNAYADAAEALESAHDVLLRRLPDASVAARLNEIRERLADALAESGGADRALATYADLAAAEPPALDRGRLRRKTAVLLGDVRGRLSDALALLDEAERDVEQTEPAERERAEIAVARALLLRDHGAYERTLAAARAAVAVARACGADDLVTRALLHQSIALDQLGRVDDAERTTREALARARSRGDRVAEAQLYALLAGHANRRGRSREGLELLERGREIRRELGHTETAADLANFGFALVPAGELARSRAILTEAIERARAMRDEFQEMSTGADLGRTLFQLGELEEARRVLERTIALADRMGNAERGGFARHRLAEVAIAEERFDEALRLSTEVGQLAEKSGSAFLRLAAHGGLARRAVRMRNATEGVKHARLAVQISHDSGYLRAEAAALPVLAEAEWLAGDRAAAKEHIEASLALYRSGGEAYYRISALDVHARTVFANRPRERDRTLREALGLAKQIGAALLVRQLEEALAARV